MAETVMDIQRCLGLALAVFCTPSLAAGVLPDPTRPPPAVLAAEQARDGSIGQVGDPSDAPEPALQLEMVMQGAGGASAMINGQMVRRGEIVRGMKVVAIREMEVELRGPQGVERLRMVPVSKKVVLAPKAERKDQKN